MARRRAPLLWSFWLFLVTWSIVSMSSSHTAITVLTIHSEETSTAPLIVTSRRATYAIAFLIAGCDPRLGTYRPFLYNVLIAAHILRQQGSTSDIVVFLQLSKSYSIDDRIPEHYDLLQVQGMHVFYIPPSPHESYYRTSLDKFRILNLTLYQRVLFLDADVMPITNLDYLLELSAKGILKENVVMHGPKEPANGGFFILQPGSLHTLQHIIERKEARPEFSKQIGWGTVPMDAPWYGKRNVSSMQWNFYAASADQGLLYYWVRYHKGSYSVFRDESVEHWSHPNDSKGGAMMESSLPLRDIWDRYGRPPNVKDWVHPDRKDRVEDRDFVHFMGKRKPWMSTRPIGNQYRSPVHYWHAVADQLGLKVEFNGTLSSPLGLKPSNDKSFVNLLEPAVMVDS